MNTTTPPTDYTITKPEKYLKQILSTKPQLSSYFQIPPQDLHKGQIGKGQCGTIHTLSSLSNTIIKLPNSPRKIEELVQDMHMHKRVQEAFTTLSTTGPNQHIKIPALKGWVEPCSQQFWNRKNPLDASDPEISIPNFGLLAERIYPLALPIKTALLQSLYPHISEKERELVLAKTQNKDCLVRLYLGRRDIDRSKTPPENTQMRNLPLHVDEMGKLGLDIKGFAKSLAAALAVLHWGAGVDANDVEFVLASSLPASSEEMAGAENRSVAIWLLDFNQCKEFECNEAGLKQLVDGFWWNDPYFPRPGDKRDGKLWKGFVKRYLEVSAGLTGSDMPRLFVKSVEERGSKRSLGSLFG